MAFFGLLGRKSSAIGRLLVTGHSEARWTPRDYKSFAHEGYQKNVIAYQAIKKVSDAVASVKWGVWKGDKELSDHPLIALLKNPNPMQGGAEFMRAKVGFLMISGNAYDERIVVSGNAMEMYTMRPDRMRVKEGSTGFPSGYRYTAGSKHHDWVADPQTGVSDIRHLKLFNPLDDWYGQSPIEAGAFAVDQHNESMAWMQALLQNSARPSGALIMKDDKSLTDDQFAKLKAEVEGQYSGSGNAGRPMLLEGGLDWKQMGLSPTDMGIIEGKNSSARDVSLAFGVPPQLIGIPGDSTYSNYQEARLAFWEDTAIPLVDYIGSEFNGWMSDLYEGVEIRPDLDIIPAIADKRRTLWAMADASMDLTINERRKIKGFEPIDGGDIRDIPQPKDPVEEKGLSAEFIKAIGYGQD